MTRDDQQAQDLFDFLLPRDRRDGSLPYLAETALNASVMGWSRNAQPLRDLAEALRRAAAIADDLVRSAETEGVEQ